MKCQRYIIIKLTAMSSTWRCRTSASRSFALVVCSASLAAVRRSFSSAWGGEKKKRREGRGEGREGDHRVRTIGREAAAGRKHHARRPCASEYKQDARCDG